MKKVFKNPIVIILLLCIFFIVGAVWGRYSRTTIINQKTNELTGRPYAEEESIPEPEDYVISDKVNINSASANTLAIFPGIGETLAERIVAYREEHGPYQSIEDLLNVEGIGENKLNLIRNYIIVG